MLKKGGAPEISCSARLPKYHPDARRRTGIPGQVRNDGYTTDTNETTTIHEFATIAVPVIGLA